MAKDLQDVSADYVFFCAYLAKDDPDEAAKCNGQMLSNFIDALKSTGAIQKLKRFVLTCGFKQYGVHLGLPKQPMIEEDPLIEKNIGGVDWPANFYYEQQRILEAAAKEGQWQWVATLPQDVIGYAKGNFMNEATALGLYCAVSRALPGAELPFPGSRTNYLAFNCWTSAKLHAQFCLWAATAPKAGNNIFNIMNGDTESFQNIWPRLAARFGCKIPNPMFPSGGTPNSAGYKDYEPKTWQMETKPPLVVHAASLGIEADDLAQTPTTFHLQIDPEKWAKRPEVIQTWEKLRDKFNLDQQAWDKATWSFLTFVLARDYSNVGSMSKARKMGWTGYQDTWESMEETFDVLEKEGILPPSEKLREGKEI